jgi:YHS domain-containing protein
MSSVKIVPLLFSVLLSISISTSISTFAKDSPLLNSEDGIALHGYDPVSYFQKSGPVEGKKEFTIEDGGATYHFLNSENRESFKKEPKKYLPAYGGYCAYAMGASGDFVDIEPTSYKITNGKLLLFYKGVFNDTRAKWNKAESDLSAKAEANWKTELSKRGVK